MGNLETFRGFDQELRLDTSGESGYLVIGPKGAHVRLSASAYHLLQAGRTGQGWDALAAAIGRHQGRDIDASELEASYLQLAERLGEIDDRPSDTRLPPGFWLRWPLLSRATVGRIAARLSALFSPWPALVLLSAIVAALPSAVAAGIRVGPLIGAK